MLYSQEGNSVIKVSSSSKAYGVYNKTHGIVEEAYDVEFDETNGSHNEQENLDDVRSDCLRNAMKNMSIGDVRPREEDEDKDGPSISIRINPSTSISNNEAQPIVQDSSNDDSQVQDQVGSSSAPSINSRTHCSSKNTSCSCKGSPGGSNHG